MEPRSTPLPQTIGRFRVEELLGSGGMGEVYKAFDPTLQRPVAVKTVRPEFDRPEYLTRLYREAQAAARLQHPNIVTVYEAGEIDGVVYVAMEHLKGQDLARLLEQSTLTFERKIGILLQTLDGLSHAHGEGVIHRDIKPANVFVQPDGVVKLVDFGLARVLRADTLTVAGTVMGTPHYSSPEQLRGQPVDPRSDIYSVGALAYEMCTGRRPFADAEDVMTKLLVRVLSDPPPPMDVSWSRLYPGFERIIMRAMAKAPEDRFQTAADMRGALADFLATAPVIPSSAPDAMTMIGNGSQLPPTVMAGSDAPPDAAPAGAAMATTTAPRRRSRGVLWLGAAAAIVLATVGAVVTRQAATDVPEAASSASAAVQPTAFQPAPSPPPASESKTPAVAPVTPVTAAPARPAPSGASGPPASTAAAPSVPATTASQLFYGPGQATPGAVPPGGSATAATAGLRYQVLKGDVEVDPTLSTFHSGDTVHLNFESNSDGYLYVAAQGSSGTWSVLFPHPDVNGGRNAVRKFEPYDVPQGGHWKFDATPGTEELFVFFSKEPLAELPGFEKPLTKPETLMAAVVDKLQQRVQSRDLIFEKTAASGTSPGAKATHAFYIVNREQVGKAVSATIKLVHEP